MPKSDAFVRNAAKVADVVDSIPRGRCTTYGAIGSHLGIVARYVALIMATAPDVAGTPWHRVVGADASLKHGGHRGEQARRLRLEGFEINDWVIADFDHRIWSPG